MIYFGFVDSSTTDTRAIYDEVSITDRQQTHLDLHMGGIYRPWNWIRKEFNP